MHCPHCPASLKRFQAVDGLQVHRCETGHGLWLELDVYRAWRNRKGGVAVPAPAGEAPAVADDTRAAACPSCRRLMQKQRLSARLEYRVDRCGVCHGVWFGQGEWQSMLDDGLLPDLIDILSDRGQRAIREALGQLRMEEHWKSRFGDDVYAELQRIRRWLDARPNRAELLGWLNGAGQE